jgi:hypothetical protein
LTEETRQTLARLLDANEPEALVAAVGRMCERKKDDRFIDESERDRWTAAAKALANVSSELQRAGEPQAAQGGEAA